MSSTTNATTSEMSYTYTATYCVISSTTPLPPM
jgi:hypothetical protein